MTKTVTVGLVKHCNLQDGWQQGIHDVIRTAEEKKIDLLFLQDHGAKTHFDLDHRIPIDRRWRLILSTNSGVLLSPRIWGIALVKKVSSWLRVDVKTAKEKVSFFYNSLRPEKMEIPDKETRTCTSSPFYVLHKNDIWRIVVESDVNKEERLIRNTEGNFPIQLPHDLFVPPDIPTRRNYSLLKTNEEMQESFGIRFKEKIGERIDYTDVTKALSEVLKEFDENGRFSEAQSSPEEHANPVLQESNYESYLLKEAQRLAEGKKIKNDTHYINIEQSEEILGISAYYKLWVDEQSPERRKEAVRDHYQRIFEDAAEEDARPSSSELDFKLPSGTPLPSEDEFNVGPITTEELLGVVKEMKPGVALGIDRIPSEVLCVPAVAEKMTIVMNNVFEGETTVPGDWTKELLQPAPKASSEEKARQVSDFRGISILSHVAKAYKTILRKRLQPIVDRYLRHEINAYREKRTTHQHVYALRKLIEFAKRSPTKAVIKLLDFAKAFDSVDTRCLRPILKAYKVSPRLINAICNIYGSSREITVRTEDGDIPFNRNVSKGIPQGDPLGPFLFSTLTDWVTRKALPGDIYGIPFGEEKIAVLLYSDDVVLLSDSEEQSHTMFRKFMKYAKRIGLRENTKKTMCVTVSRSNVLIKKDNEEKDNFSCLGSMFPDCLDDMRKQRRRGLRDIDLCQEIWKSNLEISMRVKVFQKVVMQKFLCNMKTWILRDWEAAKIDEFDEEMIRKAFPRERLEDIEKELTELRPLSKYISRKRKMYEETNRREDAPDTPLKRILLSGEAQA